MTVLMLHCISKRLVSSQRIKYLFLNLKSYFLFEILIKTVRNISNYGYESTVILCIFENNNFSDDQMLSVI